MNHQKNCPNCGKHIEPGNSFCPSCGEKIPDSQTPGKPSTKRIISTGDVDIDRSVQRNGSGERSADGIEGTSTGKILSYGDVKVDQSRMETHIHKEGPKMVTCDLCGSRVEEGTTFRCKRCGDTVCKIHRDHKHLVCAKCAEIMDHQEIEKGTESRMQDPAQAVYENLANLSNPSPQFNIRVWTDRNQYRVGDKVRIFFQSDIDCYLWLLDVGTSGNMSLIFPNPHALDNYIKAKRRYCLPDDNYPFEYILNPPTGIETIKAIATIEPLDLAGLSQLNPDQAFATIQKPVRVTRDIGLRVQMHAPSGWTTSDCEFNVEP